MGFATTTIYTRPGVVPTPQQFCDTANNVLKTFADAGMVPVSHTDFTGQFESFVRTSTGNAKDKVVSSISTSNLKTRMILGYRVFRHPTKNYYIKVDCGYEADNDSYQSTTATRICINLTLGLGLDGVGGFSGTPINLIVKNNTYVYPESYMMNGTYMKPLTLRVSMGANHFTCCASYDFYGINESSNYNNIKTGMSTIALAIIGSKDTPRHSVVFYPRTAGWVTSYFDENTTSNLSEDDCQLQRKYLIDHQTNTYTFLGSGQTVNTMPEVGLVSDTVGVRVAQPYITVNGVLLPLEMGCIHAGATTDMGLLTVDIDGSGAKQFYAPFGMGPCSWVPWDQPLMRIPVFLLPYY